MHPIRRITFENRRHRVRDIIRIRSSGAVFLTTTSKEGLGKQLFADWRYQGDGLAAGGIHSQSSGSARRRDSRDGPQFGCGSSREHATLGLL